MQLENKSDFEMLNSLNWYLVVDYDLFKKSNLNMADAWMLCRLLQMA